MARLWYGRTPAEFVIDFGATADILDDQAEPTGEQGVTVLLPLQPRELGVYTAPDPSEQTTDLLDESGNPIESISTDTNLDDLATYPRFQGPEDHEGPLFVSADGLRFYRLEPDSTELYGRVTALEAASGVSLATTDLTDVSDDVSQRTDGAVLAWDEAEEAYVPAQPSEFVSGVASVNGQDGDVELTAGDVGAAPATHTHSGADITSGTVDVARLPVGTNSWQVAAGNHTHAINHVQGLQAALDEKVTASEVAKVWPVIGPNDPTPPGAQDGDIIVRRVQ